MAKVNASLDHAGRDSSPGSKRLGTQQKSLRGLAMIGVLGTAVGHVATIAWFREAR